MAAWRVNRCINETIPPPPPPPEAYNSEIYVLFIHPTSPYGVISESRWPPFVCLALLVACLLPPWPVNKNIFTFLCSLFYVRLILFCSWLPGLHISIGNKKPFGSKIMRLKAIAIAKRSAYSYQISQFNVISGDFSFLLRKVIITHPQRWNNLD